MLPVHFACRFITKIKLNSNHWQKYLAKEKIIKDFNH